MTRQRNSRTIVLALAVAAMAAFGMGCTGGGDGGAGASTSLTPPATSLLLIPGEGGAVNVVDNLSSFSAKDPFKAQAVVTTKTTSTTTTTIRVTTTTRSTTTTTRSTTTTTRSTTTTTSPAQTTTTGPAQTTTTVEWHFLQLNVIMSSGGVPFVIYTLDFVQRWGQEVGDVVDTGLTRIEVLEIDEGAGTAKFNRDGPPPDGHDFTLVVGATENW